jgi:polysaccharide export outer membrane protein
MKSFVATILFAGALAAQTTATFADRDQRYRLQAEDKIEVQYRYTPEYNAQAALQPDGCVSLPLVGDVKVAGLTLEQAAAAIKEKAGERLRDPEVTVLLKEYVKPYFVVAGEVAHPGKFELHGQVSLIEALAVSGGMKDSAKRTQVILMRKSGNDVAEVHLLNVRKLMSASNIREDIAIHSGDTIVVPRNFISRVEPYIRLSETAMYAVLWGVR